MTIATLSDRESGTRAEILVSQGFNCFRFLIPRDGRPGPTQDVLWAEADFESGACRPSGSGIPLLFPFPGRIAGTSITWQGRTYSLQEGDGRGHAIHGFVHTRPWRVVAQSKTELLGEFQASRDDPELLDHWPSDFRLQATYRLHGRSLLLEMDVTNCGTQSLPCGFGAHPYFRVPLDPGSSLDDCRLVLPTTYRWELVDMIPTGRRLALPDAASLAEGVPLADLELDDVFTGLQGVGRQFEARLQQGSRAVTLAFARGMPHCVVYTPPHRQAICVEPYSCAPDALRLAEQGIDAGLRVLAPGERWHTWMRIDAT